MRPTTRIRRLAVVASVAMLGALLPGTASSSTPNTEIPADLAVRVTITDRPLAEATDEEFREEISSPE